MSRRPMHVLRALVVIGVVAAIAGAASPAGHAKGISYHSLNKIQKRLISGSLAMSLVGATSDGAERGHRHVRKRGRAAATSPTRLRPVRPTATRPLPAPAVARREAGTTRPRATTAAPRTAVTTSRSTRSASPSPTRISRVEARHRTRSRSRSTRTTRITSSRARTTIAAATATATPPTRSTAARTGTTRRCRCRSRVPPGTAARVLAGGRRHLGRLGHEGQCLHQLPGVQPRRRHLAEPGPVERVRGHALDAERRRLVELPGPLHDGVLRPDRLGRRARGQGADGDRRQPEQPVPGPDLRHLDGVRGRRDRRTSTRRIPTTTARRSRRACS